MKKDATTEGITAKKNEDMSEWYQQVVLKSDLADYAPIHGFMIIKPRAYAIWESIQEYFDPIIKKHGVKNAYFPLLIPESFFKKEAEHAEGFAPELAWIQRKDEKEERLAIRPTSETIMYDAFGKWIRSWRDLPLRINQWCNVLRWEVKQTKPFLRTREFLWQEGHCVYATKEECDKEVKLFLDEYQKMLKNILAIPVIAGRKTEAEKFPGAHYTTTIEAFMPDGKALQCGTSHNLGQGFAKGFGISFKDENEKDQLPWQSSWGFSTRLIGALVMTHGDDKGLVLPPNITKEKIVIVPILFDKTKSATLKKAKEIEKTLKAYGAWVDDREQYSVGWKFNEHELHGIPLRIELGPKDMEKKHVVIVRRDSGKKEFVLEKNLKIRIPEILEEMQNDMYSKAEKFLKENIIEVKTYAEFKKVIDQRKIASVYFCGDKKMEEKIKEETGATSRCIPFDQKQSAGKCFYSDKPVTQKVLFAKTY